MKRIFLSAVLVMGFLGFVSCERHEWEDSEKGKKDGTKNLYDQGHGDKDGDQSH